MKYISTRGEAAPQDFTGVLLAGLAEDNGLYVPAEWPHFSPADFRAMRELPYPELASRIMQPFVGDSIPFVRLTDICRDAYASFGHPAICPLVQLDHDLWTQELFHGPTLAFKDMAMQVLARLFDECLTRQKRHITIVGATSGDTGSSAIEACRGRRSLDVVMLHPEGRTSEVQRRQMTTVLDDNIANVAVAGTFDDCQDLVKAMFAAAPFRREFHLSAVNSINWARIAAQIPYYVAAALALGAPEREVTFAVPTGNFGNVLAAWAARRIGLPIARLVVAANRNDILARFLAANDMSIQPVHPSLSPSMDIQISSNFERLLFELLDRDAARTTTIMQQFRATGRMPVPDAAWRRATSLFAGFTLDDAGTEAEMRRLWREAGYLADPHTAIGVAAGRAMMHKSVHGLPMIAMATAAPAKFPAAVSRATGVTPPLPPRLADLYDRPEKFSRAANDLAAVEALVRAMAQRNIG